MDDDPRQKKRLLRKRMTAALGAIAPDERAARSAAICARIAASDLFKRSKMVLLYVPSPEEVDVRPLLRTALEQGKACAAPRMDWERQGMWAVEVSRHDFPVEIRRFAVAEPLEATPAPPERIDLVVTPGLAFDRRGRRLGRGGGYYDRFLAAWRQARLDAGAGPGTALGVCFGPQLVERVPNESHDVALDGLAWEDGLVACRDGDGPADTSA